jgi:hypothetical protein
LLLGYGVGLFEYALHGRGGDAVGLRDFAQAVAVSAIAADGVLVEDQRVTSDVSSFEAGAPHAGADPLDNKVAFKLGDGTDDDHQGAAKRAASVDLLAERDELDVKPAQLIEDIEEVPHRPGDSVRCPYQNDIELTAAGVS